MDALDALNVVLARPKEAGNIGAVCRVIKNFGIRRLVLVGARDFDREEARRRAVNAEDILEGAAEFDDIGEALAPYSLNVALTRRLGQRRKTAAYTPWELARHLRQTGPAEAGGTGFAVPIAMVFGNETSGLSDEELLYCHVAVQIPTAGDCPSMNLSHAVGVIAYELARPPDRANGDERGAVVPAVTQGADAAEDAVSAARLDAAAEAIVGDLGRLGYLVQEGPQGMRLFLRDILARAALRPAELSRMTGLFSKLAGMHGTHPNG